MRDINESDWKHLRELHPVALERFCERILVEVTNINADRTRRFHQRYFDIHELLHRRDKELAETFDDLKRSRALEMIAAMTRRGLLTDFEIMRFGQETRTFVGAILGKAIGLTASSAAR